MLEHPFFKHNEDFQAYGTQHLIVLGLMLSSILFLCTVGKKRFSENTKIWVGRAIAISISFWVVAYVVILIGIGKFNYLTDLPLDLCNIIGLSLPVLVWHPTRRVHQVLYFILLGGTMQGVLTPHLYSGFPSFAFIKFWWVHSGMVIYIIYASIVYNQLPTLKGIWHAFLVLNAYMVLMFFVNSMLGSNYFYVMRKPPTASLLDHMGPWPWYLLAVQFLGVLIFFLLYSPVGIHRWLKGRKDKGASIKEVPHARP